MKEKTYEYEVKWQFKTMENNTWVEKEILVKMGYLKLVQREELESRHHCTDML